MCCLLTCMMLGMAVLSSEDDSLVDGKHAYALLLLLGHPRSAHGAVAALFLAQRALAKIPCLSQKSAHRACKVLAGGASISATPVVSPNTNDMSF